LQKVEKADEIFVPVINIVEIIATIVSVWQFITTPYGFPWFNLAGLILFLSGVVIYLRARLTLGKYFSEKHRLLETHELVTTGIYAHIRHPIFTAGMLLLPGLALFLNSCLGFFVMLLYFPLILIRIPFEEEILKNAFGQEYIDYMNRTKKLVSFLY
jgi:protein-S-isoprenylcysteine O-methyltransferase Ste14